MLKGTIKLSSITSTGVSSVTVPASTATTAERVSASIRLLCAEGPATPQGSQTLRITITDFVNVESAVVFSDDLGGKFPYNGRWSCGISKSREGTWPGPAAALAVRSSHRSQPQSQLHNMMSRFLQYSLDYRYRVHNQALVSSAGTRIFVRLDPS